MTAARATHSNDSRTSRLQKAEARFAENREVVDMATPDVIAEERDWQINGHKEVTLRDALKTEHTAALSPEKEAWRVRNWHALCRYVFQDGIANPWQAFKNLLAVVRRVNPEYLGGISQTTLAILMTSDPRKRAQFSAREKRIFEAQMKKWGVAGFHGLGGTKSEAARAEYAKAQKGNTNRRDGTERKKKAA